MWGTQNDAIDRAIAEIYRNLSCDMRKNDSIHSDETETKLKMRGIGSLSKQKNVGG